MNERQLGALFLLNQEAWAEVSRDRSLPQSVKTMVYLHLQKPWVPNFLAVAVAPLKPGLERFLKVEAFNHGGLTYRYPSREWWLAHARSSHPPDGAGCDAQAHADFLTAGGANAEFSYANVLKSGEVVVLGPPDFEEECAFWGSGTSG